MRRTLTLAVLALSLAALIGGTSPSALAQPAGGKTLIMALDQSDVKTLDPGREFEFGAAFVDLNVYDTLVAHKSPKELNTFLPILATEWKVSPDGKEYTFKLRPNVKFASGNPFTAEDVKFSLTRLKNLKANPGWMMDPLKEVVVIDPMTVKTVLNDSFADWLPVLSGPNAAIMDSKLAKEHGATDSATADKDDKAEEWLNQNSAGGGPFILKGWQKNNVIIMERNPNYWKGPAKIAKIEARDVPSPATQKLQVENGDVDVALNITPDLTAAMKGNKNVKIQLGQSLDNMYMGLTVDPALHPALAKKEVRQAIRHAVDRAGIIKLTNGRAVIGPAVYPIGVLGLETQADADRAEPEVRPEARQGAPGQGGLPERLQVPALVRNGPVTGWHHLRVGGAEDPVRPEEDRDRGAAHARRVLGHAVEIPPEGSDRGHFVQPARLHRRRATSPAR